MVHMPYVRYHNNVTSGNPGKNRPALTNCPCSRSPRIGNNRRLRWLTTVIRRKNIKILKSVKVKQNDVSCEVLIIAIDVKCNFTSQINTNQGKTLNIVTDFLGGGTGN